MSEEFAKLSNLGDSNAPRFAVKLCGLLESHLIEVGVEFMANEQSSADDPPAPADGTPAEAPSPEEARVGASVEVFPKTRRPFTKLGVELETDDLAQKGVQKMILAEVSRLESEVAEMHDHRKRFHDVDKQCAVLKARARKDKKTEILYTIGIAVGGALIGWLPSIPYGGGTWFVAVVASALIIGALAAKWTGDHNED